MTGREDLYRVATPLKSDGSIDDEPLCSTWLPYRGLFAVSLCSQDGRRGSQSSPMPRSGWMKPTRMGGRARGVLLADAALTGCRLRGAIVALRSRVEGSKEFWSRREQRRSRRRLLDHHHLQPFYSNAPKSEQAWQQQAQDEFRRSVWRLRVQGVEVKGDLGLTPGGSSDPPLPLPLVLSQELKDVMAASELQALSVVPDEENLLKWEVEMAGPVRCDRFHLLLRSSLC